MKRKILAGLAGGVLAGFISIIPIIGWLWFIWAALGGLLAVFIYYLWVKPKIELVDSAIVAGIAGLVGAIINIVGVLVWSIISALFIAIASRGSNDFVGTFVTSFGFGLISLALNLVISVVMFFITGVVGFLLGLVLHLIGQNSQSSSQPSTGIQAPTQPSANPFDNPPAERPVNPFDQPPHP